YKYHYVVSAHRGGRRLQTRLKEGKYHYMFGDDFLIAPIYKDSKTRQVSLPEGKWRYFFEDRTVVEGPKTIERDFELAEFPVYIKEGAIVPLNVKRDYTQMGDDTSEGFVTFLIFPDVENAFSYYNPHTSEETLVSYINENGTLKIAFEGERI